MSIICLQLPFELDYARLYEIIDSDIVKLGEGVTSALCSLKIHDFDHLQHMQRNQQNSSPSAQFLANIDLSGISAGSSNIKKSCVTRGADSGKIRFQLPSSTVLPTPPIDTTEKRNIEPPPSVFLSVNHRPLNSVAGHLFYFSFHLSGTSSPLKLSLIFGSSISSGPFGYSGYVRFWDVRSGKVFWDRLGVAVLLEYSNCLGLVCIVISSGLAILMFFLSVSTSMNEIVNKLQEKNHICGMTGDCVNDPPFLKKAGIGITVVDAPAAQ
ncbi:hypothetical protein DCAR_0101012 [Daucus carota subsp. sativus]|uniref:Uncharacterized protein n=1 Tax=Daucus carota subsp. sativus TaxID=79200 RepID=A0A175YCL0_DAUCS|nr:hypothetical protein DCAR_0101012 [Daucus carota subsp. sativus]